MNCHSLNSINQSRFIG